jgi:hypothetical protein
MGRLDVDAMLAELSSEQLSEWMAYDMASVTPLERSTALLCSVIANASAGGTRTFTESDFLVRRVPAPEMSDADIFAHIRAIVPAESPQARIGNKL